MAQALEMFFDLEASTAVRHLWARLDQAGIPSMATVTHRRHRPHITLINTQTLSPTDALIAELETLLRLEVRLNVLGVFPGQASALFLGAVTTGTLLEAHAAIHAIVTEERAGFWEHYQPGFWVPHCALALGLDAAGLDGAVSLLHPFLGLTAHVAEIGVVDTDTGDHVCLVR